MTRFITALFTICAISIVFSACDQSTTPSSDAYEATLDNGLPDMVPDNGPTETAGEEVVACVDLTIDGHTECVSEQFYFYATEVIPGTWTRTNDGLVITGEVHHISSSPEIVPFCPNSKFILNNFDPQLSICLSDTLELTFCKNDINTCVAAGAVFITAGLVTKSENKYVVSYTACAKTETNCATFTYEKNN